MGSGRPAGTVHCAWDVRGIFSRKALPAVKRASRPAPSAAEPLRRMLRAFAGWVLIASILLPYWRNRSQRGVGSSAFADDVEEICAHLHGADLCSGFGECECKRADHARSTHLGVPIRYVQHDSGSDLAVPAERDGAGCADCAGDLNGAHGTLERGDGEDARQYRTRLR